MDMTAAYDEQPICASVGSSLYYKQSHYRKVVRRAISLQKNSVFCTALRLTTVMASGTIWPLYLV